MSELQANPNGCQEASLWSNTTYIPCNKPAINIVGWKGRLDTPIRMCEMCTDHNIRNRGGEIIKVLVTANAWPEPKPSNPLDAMNEDQLLLLWADKKKAIETAKEEEMELRKYIVKREFPKAEEGTTRKDIGNGYQLKTTIKYNYKCDDNDKVEAGLNQLSALGNDGPFIADRLINWTPNFRLVEYRTLCDDKDKGSAFAEKALKIIATFMTITEAVPTLEIIEPKKKK